MKKYIIIAIFSIFIIDITFAQENTPTNFYSINPQMLNPAHVGQDNPVELYINNRYQWYGVKDAPEFINVGVHGKVAKGLGLGANFNQFTSGIFKESIYSVAASYGQDLYKNHHLNLGLSFGIMKNKVVVEYDGITDYTDITLNSNYFGETFLRTGFGLNYLFKDLIQVDFSLPVIYSERNEKYLQTMVLYGCYNYKFKAIGKDMKLSPALMYRKSMNKLSSIDITATIDVVNKIWVLAGYRNTSGIIVGVGIKAKQFAFAYAYENNQAPISYLTNSTHEITAYFSPNFKKRTR